MVPRYIQKIRSTYDRQRYYGHLKRYDSDLQKIRVIKRYDHQKIRINKRYELEKIRNDFLKDTKYSYGAAHIQHTVLYPCYAYVEYDRCQVGGDHEELSDKHIRTRRCSWLLECDVLQPFELTS